MPPALHELSPHHVVKIVIFYMEIPGSLEAITFHVPRQFVQEIREKHTLKKKGLFSTK